MYKTLGREGGKKKNTRSHLIPWTASRSRPCTTEGSCIPWSSFVACAVLTNYDLVRGSSL